MKFLVDECVGPRLAKWLCENGYDAVSIYDFSPGITDDAVLKKALNENRILITLDKDFGDMVFAGKMRHAGIILLRLTDNSFINKVNKIIFLIENYNDKLENYFIVVTDKSIRIISTTF